MDRLLYLRVVSSFVTGIKPLPLADALFHRGPEAYERGKRDDSESDFEVGFRDYSEALRSREGTDIWRDLLGAVI
jgi:hypothetical protein